MKKLLLSMILSAPIAMGCISTPKEPVYACREAPVEAAAVAEVQGLFAELFGNAMHQTREQWSAEHRAYYFAFSMRAKDGVRVLNECVWLLAEDGHTLRYITCEKLADGTRRAFTERVQQAVKPFLFVKIEADAAYFSHWNPVPDSRNMIRVEQVRVDFSTCTFPMTRRMTQEEKSLMARYARTDTQAEQWDAENKVLWQSKYHGYLSKPYTSVGLHVFSTDEKHCRFMSAKLNEKGEIAFGCVMESVYVMPGVYVSVTQSEPSNLQIWLFEKNQHTGAPVPASTMYYHISTQRLLQGWY
jgi:hypothetical protein